MKFVLAAGLVSLSAAGSAAAGTYSSAGTYGNPFETITGAEATSVWSDVSEVVHSSFPGWPGSSSWGATIAPNSSSGTATDIELARVSGSGGGLLGGGPYPSDDTIYFGGLWPSDDTGGVLKVDEFDPVTGLTEVVFQAQLGEASLKDFTPSTAPVLTYYTATTGPHTATLVSGGQVDSFVNGTYSNGEYDVDETVILNEHKYVWNFTGAPGAVTSFKIEWSQVMHSQLYGLQVDQKD